MKPGGTVILVHGSQKARQVLKEKLEKDGKKLKLLVDAPKGELRMKTWSTIGPNSYDAPNPGTILVGFELTLPANTSAFTNVYLLPGTTKKSKKNKQQLSKWGN
jgi:hypothetical protein